MSKAAGLTAEGRAASVGEDHFTDGPTLALGEKQYPKLQVQKMPAFHLNT